jgi:hypothetical protein
MILRILEAEVIGSHSLILEFNNGVCKQVNVFPLLDGPIFKPLHDPVYFARMVLDPVAGTVVWPNEADFAPETLYELEAEDESSSTLLQFGKYKGDKKSTLEDFAIAEWHPDRELDVA